MSLGLIHFYSSSISSVFHKQCQYPSQIYRIQDTGNQAHFPFHFERLPVLEVTILLWITYFDLIEIVRDSRLLEWYSVLEDHCFVNQLY